MFSVGDRSIGAIFLPPSVIFNFSRSWISPIITLVTVITSHSPHFEIADSPIPFCRSYTRHPSHRKISQECAGERTFSLRSNPPSSCLVPPNACNLSCSHICATTPTHVPLPPRFKHRRPMTGPPNKRQKREAYRQAQEEAAATGPLGLPKKKFYRQRAHANPFSDHALT
jgi:hypothetical protein